MSSSIRSLNPLDHLKHTAKSISSGDYTQAIIDPGDIFSQGEVMDAEDEAQAVQAAADAATAADAAAQAAAQASATDAQRVADAAKKKKKTTSSVLTSPLGTSTAKTAVTKLGGM